MTTFALVWIALYGLDPLAEPPHDELTWLTVADWSLHIAASAWLFRRARRAAVTFVVNVVLEMERQRGKA